ncbi:MAG: hypothetical protein LBH55_02030, partial [Mycoplasmataceae bacterium]|nr:hypothetical protein [Mycoplasmataceae bacterium]
MQKTIFTPFKTRIKYIAKYWLQGISAYELGKEIYRKHLTNIKKYPYCRNKEGELCIYQWIYQYFKPIKFDDKRFKNYNFCCMSKNKIKELSKEEIIKEYIKMQKNIRNLKNGIKRRDWLNGELKKVIEIQKDILKDNGVKINKDNINKK